MFNTLGRKGLGVTPCLWGKRAYEVPPIPSSWAVDSDSDDEGEDDDDDLAEHLNDGL
jgi:hypothetical protein